MDSTKLSRHTIKDACKGTHVLVEKEDFFDFFGLQGNGPIATVCNVSQTVIHRGLQSSEVCT